MVSTLKITKIQIPNSDSDVLSFNSSTGIMTFHKDIQGEGTATTILQQALVKVWIDFPGAATSISDSLNIASISDTGTGNGTVNFTNSMSSTAYAFTNGHQYTTATGGNAFFSNASAQAAAGAGFSHYQNGGLADPVKYGLGINGDLA